jgi:YVTN family beta-propeller protein
MLIIRNRRSMRPAAVLGLAVVILAVLASVAYSGDTVIATVPVGVSPSAVAVNPVSHRVYVTNYNGGNVSIIDGTTDSNVATVGSGSLTVPICVVTNHLTPQPLAYVGNFWTGSIQFIDEASSQITATVSTGPTHGGGPRALALDLASSPQRLFAAIYGRNEVAVYNATTAVKLATIPVGGAPRALALYMGSGGEQRLYVVNRTDNTVSVIDASDYSSIGTVSVGAGAKSVAVDQDTGTAYVTAETANAVTVIATDAAVLARVDVGTTPRGVAVDATRDRVFVANSGSGNVSVLRTSDYTHEATVTAGTTPQTVGIDEPAGKAFVLNQGSASVTVLDALLNGSGVAVGGQPTGVAVDSASTPHKAYVTNWASGTVSVVDEPANSGAPQVAAPVRMVASGPGAPVDVVVDAVDPQADGSVVVTGRALGVRSPVALPVEGVYWRGQGTSAWQPAEVLSGLGTAEASWRFSFGAGKAPGTYQLEVGAFDAAGATSNSSDNGGESAAFGGVTSHAVVVPPRRYEQTDPLIRYTGAWRTYKDAGNSGGTFGYSTSTTASAVLAFTGTGFDLIAYKGPSAGRFAAYVDGGPPVVVDLYSTTRAYQQKVLSRHGLAAGTHLVRLEPLSTRTNDIDAIDVDGTLSALPLDVTAPVTGDDAASDYATAAVITLTPADAGSGVACTRYRIDTGAWKSGTTMTVGGGGTHTLTYYSYDMEGNSEAPTTRSFTIHRYEQTDPLIGYTGTWRVYKNAAASGGSYSYATTSPATAALSFSGTGISLIAYTGPGGGKMTVSVDGEPPSTTDLYAKTGAYRQAVFSVSGLSPGVHTLLVTRVSRTVVIDALDVDGVLVP